MKCNWKYQICFLNFLRPWIGIIFDKVNGTKPLSEPMPVYCQLDPWVQTLVKSKATFVHFHSGKCIWKRRLRNGSHFVSQCVKFSVVNGDEVYCHAVILLHIQIASNLGQEFFRGVPKPVACPYYFRFSKVSKHGSPNKYHFHIWKAAPIFANFVILRPSL